MTLLVRDAFLEPALSLLPTLEHWRDGLGYSDAEFITLGARRINSFHPSGRSFLQSVRQCDLTEVSLRAYFGAASSKRRLAMLHELNTALSRTIALPGAFVGVRGRVEIFNGMRPDPVKLPRRIADEEMT